MQTPFAILLILLIFALIAVAVAFIVIAFTKKNRVPVNSVINYDPMLNTFLYSVNTDKNGIITMLSLPNVNELKYTFDKENMVITFTVYNQLIGYKVNISENNGVCMLTLKCTETDPTVKRPQPFLINSFITKKLNAIPFAYVG